MGDVFGWTIPLNHVETSTSPPSKISRLYAVHHKTRQLYLIPAWTWAVSLLSLSTVPTLFFLCLIVDSTDAVFLQLLWCYIKLERESDKGRDKTLLLPFSSLSLSWSAANISLYEMALCGEYKTVSGSYIKKPSPNINQPQRTKLTLKLNSHLIPF